jgi:hypothetical protein
MTEPQSSTTIIGFIRETFSVFREGAIVAVVVVLLLNPSYIGWIAKEAGISSALGIEFKELEKSQKETIAAQESVKNLARELAQLKVDLHALSQQPQPNPGDAKKLAKEVETLEERSQTVRRSLENSLQVQQGIIKRIAK